MMRHLPVVLAALALAGLALHAFQQQRAIAHLRAELASVREEVARPVRVPLTGERTVFSARPAAASPAPARQAAAPPAAAPTERPPVAPRAAVSGDEIARVESAMLSLLESDHPELREKLRAVVEEQQEAIAHERQELRRERWAARAEARLSELSGDAAMTEQQRRAVVDILLGSRDQIMDVMRNAETSKDILAARDTRRRLREEAEARVRELLTPTQYEAYKQAFDDDDDDGERRRGPRQR